MNQAFWDGLEKVGTVGGKWGATGRRWGVPGSFMKAAAGAARVDRMLKALKNRKLPSSRVHGAVRGLDLKNQVRGINPHVETSVLKSTASAAETQAAGGFSAPAKATKATGGHE